MPFYCYLLATENGSNTYVGATVDLDRRLRQHNHELAGGARATGIQCAKGHTWKRVCYVEGIPDWRSALQIEWRWKQLGRTQFKHVRDPVQRRIRALHALLAMDRPTTSAIPYRDYPGGPPRICFDPMSDEISCSTGIFPTTLPHCTSPTVFMDDSYYEHKDPPDQPDHLKTNQTT